MKIITLEVSSLEDSTASFMQSWKSGKPERNTRIAFATPELLRQVLTSKALGATQSAMRSRPHIHTRSRAPG